MAYSTSDIRKNLKVKMDNAPWTIIEFQFVKPGKGTAFTRTKFKNLMTGQIVEKNIRSGDSLEPVDVEIKEMEMLYQDGKDFVFMDTESYEQMPISSATIGDRYQWLLENMKCDVLFYEGRVIACELPNFIEVAITYTEPAVKGDTATNTTKEAEVATGGKVQVPLFIADGEIIKVDTRTGAYSGRVNTK